MDYELGLLSNGLRVITAPLNHTRAVSVALFVGAGSRYEQDPLAGVSHFVEHMLFKGTEARPAARQISEAIERVGGVINASTGKEATLFWAKVPGAHFTLALDVLMDQILHSRFDPVEFERERKVVLEEIAMVEDSPGEIAALLLDELLWPNQPLGRDIAGTPDSVSGLSRDHLIDYVASQYVPGNVVLAVAGDLTHQQVMEEAEKRSTGWASAPYASWEAAQDGHQPRSVRLRSKRTEQAQIELGYPAYSALHPDRYALDVMNGILGEGMSSRLFVEVREERGLAYAVHSQTSRFQDAGAFIVSASVHPHQAAETIKVVRDALDSIRSQRVPEDELTKTKEYIKGRVLLRMEDSRAVASWLGGQELLLGEIVSVDDVVQAVEAVTVDDVQRVARDVIRDEEASLAIVGPYRSSARFERLLT